MSPFAHELHALRMRYTIRQRDLAELLGYEQSYISALESGIKGPPTREFVEKLVSCLELPSDEQAKLELAVEASQRKLALDVDAAQEIYWMLTDLRKNLANLTPQQAQLIRGILGLSVQETVRVPEPVRRLRRRHLTEAAMT